MNRILLALGFLLMIVSPVYPQYSPPVTVETVDGAQRIPQVVKIVVSNGSLTVAGKTAIIATTGGDIVGPASSTDNAVARFSGTTGKLLKNTSALTLSDAGAFTFPDGVKQTFNPNATTSGLNIGANASDPSAGANGDTYYNSSTNKFRCYMSGAWSDCDVADAVSSVFGRTGAVVAATNDYTFAQIGSKPTTLAGYGITDAVAQGPITSSGLTVTASNRILGKATSGSGAVEQITVGGGLTLSIGGLISVTSGPVGGSDTQLQYNDGSTFGGISGATSNGTAVTFASTALIASNIVSGGSTLTLPSAVTDTILARTTTDTLTNKTLTASSNVLGGVTMTLGSDANGDVYYRAAGVLTRIAIGGSGTCFTSNGTVPSWGSCAAGAIGGSTGATDNAILRADGTGGATLQNSVITLADTTGAITWPATNADKLTLFTGEDFGIGVQANRMEIHTDAVASPLFLGHGAGGAMTDTFAVSSTTFSAEAKGYSTTVPTLGITSLANSTVDLIQATNTVDDTATVANLATLNTNSNGTAAAGFGSSITKTLESSTTNARTAAVETIEWKTATDASRGSLWSLSTVSAATTQRRVLVAPAFTITDNVATTILTLTVAANSVAGCTVFVTVNANDGTDYQAITTTITFTVVNKAGTTTATITQAGTSNAVSSGTLTLAATAPASPNSNQLQLTANSSLTANVEILYTVLNHTTQAITLAP